MNATTTLMRFDVSGRDLADLWQRVGTFCRAIQSRSGVVLDVEYSREARIASVVYDLPWLRQAGR